MSLWTDARVKELMARVELLERHKDAMQDALMNHANRITELEGGGKPSTEDFTPLEMQYFEKFGKLPHHRMKAETIMEAIK